MTFDLDLEHTLDTGPSGDHRVCKFGGDPATSVVEVAICAKFTDGRTDGRRTPRDCISSWNELKMKCIHNLCHGPVVSDIQLQRQPFHLQY